ncbi:hypothetical protein [Calothrix sp. PCC 6303]|uniref:hypothetical protein n=1 Tax=Calothrix sp. PCC 6303 TaxID=1170562 RepID=UPI0002A04384|nr:hypothetical protein [Calothrix sp. PCC 6303]AFZ00052.1 hypothetical protein Cal6303_0987 [Calothrix sp. PCC 6303]
MTEYPSILRLLEAERDRYILETSDLERRLSFIRQQVAAIEGLMSGYIHENQAVLPAHFKSEYSTQAFLEPNSFQNNQEATPTDPPENPTQEIEQTPPSNPKPPVVDISDIPKVTVGRKPGTIPMLPEFYDYSISNAILILMRYNPDMHFQIDSMVEELYGDNLSEEESRTAKMNIGKMLSIGVQQGKWYRVLHSTGIYTLRYEKGVTSKPIGRKSR